MKKYITFFMILFFPLSAFSQQKFIISGYVTDKNTGEVLIGATVSEKNIAKGTATNDYGFFSLSLPQGDYNIICSYIGYSSFSFNVNLHANISKNIQLTSTTLDIQEVILKPDHGKMRTNVINVENLSIKDIRQLPSVFGEADLFKAVQLQPGVKTIGDGSSGMFVRGGNSDQNLILIDEAPIYNASHMFGLLSVFNPDALNNVTFYKSNMPAQYGGRASAVIDCKMKEGNLYDYNYSVGINPLSFSLLATGPLSKEKSAFLFSARKSLIDLFYSPDSKGTFQLVPSYHDVNLKMNTKIGPMNRLFISLYNGTDGLQSLDGINNKWGNFCGTLRWSSNFSSRFFSNVSFIFSDYVNDMIYSHEGRSYEWHTGIRDFNFKYDFSLFLSPDNSVKFGINSIYHKFIPGESVNALESISRMQAFEHAAFVLNDIKLYSWLGINYGIRLSAFQNTGKAKWADYNEDHLPVNIHTNNKGIYKTSVNIEPRISVNFGMNPYHSLKFAYARNAQYMQVLQNQSLSYTSLEAWFPANNNIKPILVDVLSTGWFHETEQGYNFSAEVYYKYYQNRIDYVDHAQLIDNPFVEAETRSGKENAYGLELELEKAKGKLTGNVSYSYSRVFRQIEDINNGKEFSSPYDIPHDFRIFGNYEFNKHLSVSANWMFTSGRPVTLPVGFFYEGWDIIPIYSERNANRIPDYHRLDVAVHFSVNPKNKKLFLDFGLGFYNLYDRKNSMGYQFEAFDGEIIVTRYTFFGQIPNFSIKASF